VAWREEAVRGGGAFDEARRVAVNVAKLGTVGGDKQLSPCRDGVDEQEAAPLAYQIEAPFGDSYLCGGNPWIRLCGKTA